VDFWWIDWQQGQRTRLSGLDPLWWLNHLHFYDAARPGRGRPIIFSRWGGLGNHRYPIGFSGDTVVSWDSLAFQPYFTATAANVGYGWWSHDIGGHMDGVEDPELYLRWVQFGALSPVLRLHSTNNPYHERHPWGYDATVLQLAREAMQFRHAFIPYLYALAWHALQQGRTLVLPAYHLHPGEEPAYHCPAQYYLGPDLIAAPFTLPREGDTRLSRQVVWLPEVPGEDGRWYAVLDGVHLRAGAPYRGGGWHTLYGALEDVPLFARSGAILPFGPRLAWDGIENPAELEVHAFAGGDGHFDLYEDDGQTNAYLEGAYGLTSFRQAWHGDRLELEIDPVRGDPSVVPAERVYCFSVYGVVAPSAVTLFVDGAPRPVDASHDGATGILRLGPVRVRASQTVVLSLDGGGRSLLWRADRRAEAVRRVLRALRLDSAVKRAIDAALPDLLGGSASLDHYATHLTDGQRSALESALVR
jgi:alpha-glucosidase (family GH31 glycosyl hydrolase)